MAAFDIFGGMSWRQRILRRAGLREEQSAVIGAGQGVIGGRPRNGAVPAQASLMSGAWKSTVNCWRPAAERSA